MNLNDSPEGNVNESVIGLNDSLPENAMAVTTVGEARKFVVRLLPSLRDLKLLKKNEPTKLEEKISHRLNEVRIASLVSANI